MIGLALALALSATPFADRCHAVLDQAQRAPVDALRTRLLALAPPDIDGHPGALPSLDAAIDALDAPPTAAQREAALSTLTAICAEADRAGANAATLDRSALAGILADPRFAQRAAADWALAGLVQRFWDFIKELLQQRAVRSYSNVARAVFLGLVVLAALLLATRILRRRARPMERIAVREPEPVRSREPTAAEWLARAVASRERGELREAMRAEMRAVLAVLVERGLADRRGAATNREIARALARRGGLDELARRAGELAGRFDAAIYGTAPLERDELERFAREAALVRESAGANP